MKDREQVFANERRRRVFEYVCAYPCANPPRITAGTGIAASIYTQPVRRHLCELEKHGYVNSYRKSRQRFAYYPAEMLRVEDRINETSVAALYACLNGTSSRQWAEALARPHELFRFLYENRGEGCASKARKLNVQPNTLCTIFLPFIEQKILNKCRQRGHTYYNLNLELLLDVVDYHKQREEIFLNSLGGEVLNPKAKSNFRNVLADGYSLHLCINPMKEYLRQAGLLGKAPNLIKTCLL